MSRDEIWAEIEREALAQVRVELAVLESTPLVFGSAIAWSECLMGRTNGVSLLHRVGLHQIGHAFTACGELIPPPVRWLPLSPAVIRTKARCRDCEAEIAHTAREKVA